MTKTRKLLIPPALYGSSDPDDTAVLSVRRASPGLLAPDYLDLELV